MNDHTPTTDDEALSALLDGAWPAAEAERLRQRLAREPALTERLRALEHANEAVRRTYRGVVDEPLPARVLELLAVPAQSRSNVVDLTKKRAPTWVTLPLAAAASIALVVGLSLGVLLSPQRPSGDALGLVAASGSVPPGTALEDLLQRAPSSTTRTLSETVSATPRLSFAAAAAGYCRLVDIASAGGTSEVLACRRDAGWRIEVVNFAAAAQPGPDGLFRPASGPSPTIDAAMDALIDGAPLDAAAESELIQRRWESAAEN